MRFALDCDLDDVRSGGVDESLHLGERLVDVGGSGAIIDDRDEQRLLVLDVDVGDGGGEPLPIATDVTG